MARLPNVHPGDMLREDFLIPLEMSPYRLAKELRVTPTAVHEILMGKRAITPLTALKLSRFFGTSAKFWLNLQAAYDLEEEQNKRAQEIEEVRPYQVAAG